MLPCPWCNHLHLCKVSGKCDQSRVLEFYSYSAQLRLTAPGAKAVENCAQNFSDFCGNSYYHIPAIVISQQISPPETCFSLLKIIDISNKWTMFSISNSLSAIRPKELIICSFSIMTMQQAITVLFFYTSKSQRKMVSATQ